MTRFSVVIPLFNGAAFIGETLDSIAGQTLVDEVKVVVVDDGSSDDGLDIVAAHPLDIQIIRQSHLGVAVARNQGLAAVQSRWVTFLDQDDLWHPTRLARLTEWLGSHPDIRIAMTTETVFDTIEERARLLAEHVAVGSWASVHVPSEHPLEALVRQADVSGSSTVVSISVGLMLKGPISATTSFIADPEVLRLAGGFAPHALAMDDYWLLTNVARLTRLVKLDQPTVFYRVHLGATSRTTRLALPFLSSAVALRLGGGLVSLNRGLSGADLGPLHDHLLHEVLRSAEMEDPSIRRAVARLSGLLWTDAARARRFKAAVRRRAPDQVRSMGRAFQ